MDIFRELKYFLKRESYHLFRNDIRIYCRFTWEKRIDISSKSFVHIVIILYLILLYIVFQYWFGLMYVIILITSINSDDYSFYLEN